MTNQKTHGGQRPGSGLKKTVGLERGGLVPIYCRVYADQAAWLAGQANQQAAIREALDLLRQSSK